MIHHCFQLCVNWWKVAFAGVDKILSGKYFPQNVIAFTVLTEELLRKHVETCEELDAMLTDISNISDTAKL